MSEVLAMPRKSVSSIVVPELVLKLIGIARMAVAGPTTNGVTTM